MALACSQFPPTKSGYARTTYELAKGLSEAGNDVQIITENSGCKRIGNIAVLTQEGKKILDTKPDIVQIWGPTPLFTEQCVTYSKKKGLKVVYGINAFPGLASYYGNFAAESIDYFYQKLYLRRLLRKVDCLVFNTHDYSQTYQHWNFTHRAVIPCGISDELAHHDANSNSNLKSHSTSCSVGEESRARGKKILFVGQLRRYKGVAYLIEALKKMRSSGLDCSLEIVGQGPDARQLEGMVHKLDLENYVSFRGAPDDNELLEIYSMSNVLVLPSIGAPESFGMVLLEAAAHGVPIIATDLPGVREVARALNGTVVPPKDSSALANAISATLMANGRSAGIPNLDRFFWRKIVQDYIDLYEKLLSTKSASPFQSNETVRRLRT